MAMVKSYDCKSKVDSLALNNQKRDRFNTISCKIEESYFIEIPVTQASFKRSTEQIVTFKINLTTLNHFSHTIHCPE